jgi:uncharacterized cupin superfamily protein
VTEVVNLFDVGVETDETDPEGYRAGRASVGPQLGGELLGLSVFELPPGQSVCPYHYELGREEWLFVLAGRPTLRMPDGEQELGPWDCVFFPEGEPGAHKVTNRTGEPARVALLSNKGLPAVSVYPDSGKLAVRPPGRLFRVADAVDYWDGEA